MADLLLGFVARPLGRLLLGDVPHEQAWLRREAPFGAEIGATLP